MKAILEFNLPEESEEHIRAVHCYDAWNALSAIRFMVRNHTKYGNPANSEEVMASIQSIVSDVEVLLGEYPCQNADPAAAQ